MKMKMALSPDSVKVKNSNERSKSKKNKKNQGNDKDEEDMGCWFKLRLLGSCMPSRSKVDSSLSGISTHDGKTLFVSLHIKAQVPERTSEYAVTFIGPVIETQSKSTNDKNKDQPAVPAMSSTTTTSNAESASSFPTFSEELKLASQLRKFTFNDLKLATRNFRPESLLGEGGFGCVFKGWIEENGTAPVKPGTGLTVAVKTLNHDGLQGHKEWLAEVSFLGNLLHKNLVKLVGYCIEDDQRLLVYEFMPRGSLENHLFRKKSKISDVHKSNHTLEVYVESVKVLDLYMMNFPNTSPISLRALKFYQYYFLELWRLAVFRCASVHFKVITFGSSIAPESAVGNLSASINIMKKDLEIISCRNSSLNQHNLFLHMLALFKISSTIDVYFSLVTTMLCAEGSLPLPWSIRMKIALGAAQGLAFLHEEADRPVIYRDFKTSNILLDADYNSKLSDFGLAKDAPDEGKTHVSTRVMGTYGYAAPEYVMTGHLTSKSDVYSFGVVLLEMLTGRRSMDKNRPNGEHNLVEWARPHFGDKRRFYRLLDPRLEGHFSIKGAQKAIQLAAQCLSRDPKSRPRMSEVVEALKPLPNLKDMASSSYYFQTMQADRNKSNMNAKNGIRTHAGFVTRNGQPLRSLSDVRASPYNQPQQSQSPKPRGKSS
ncbi:hypothetical protein DKX38_026982 [Salix brachista]|uniref:non-specific serine/threonine protein kinase n=1 Tax=Salix brachista TaxID=2182728 RepID=A0A5N5JEG4_9ROSI|nr:hypothetical protein DKX38_026982 [Salix brachista]